MQKFMAEGMSSDEVSIPELNDALVEESLVISFVANHRFLYDFFDENQVYVFIKKGEEDQMCYEINGVAGECFSSRVDAEQAGFKSALEKLENENQ